MKKTVEISEKWSALRLMLRFLERPCESLGGADCKQCCKDCEYLPKCFSLWTVSDMRKCPYEHGRRTWCHYVWFMVRKILEDSEQV